LQTPRLSGSNRREFKRRGGQRLYEEYDDDEDKICSVAMLACIMSAVAFGQTAHVSEDPLVKNAVEAYVYLYPLVVFGVSYEAPANVEKPTWETLSAPLNQFMSAASDARAQLGSAGF
jgi:hypothetical protein